MQHLYSTTTIGRAIKLLDSLKDLYGGTWSYGTGNQHPEDYTILSNYFSYHVYRDYGDDAKRTLVALIVWGGEGAEGEPIANA